jgi:hypothetical protein
MPIHFRFARAFSSIMIFEGSFLFQPIPKRNGEHRAAAPLRLASERRATIRYCLGSLNPLPVPKKHLWSLSSLEKTPSRRSTPSGSPSFLRKAFKTWCLRLSSPPKFERGPRWQATRGSSRGTERNTSPYHWLRGWRRQAKPLCVAGSISASNSTANKYRRISRRLHPRYTSAKALWRTSQRDLSNGRQINRRGQSRSARPTMKADFLGFLMRLSSSAFPAAPCGYGRPRAKHQSISRLQLLSASRPITFISRKETSAAYRRWSAQAALSADQSLDFLLAPELSIAFLIRHLPSSGTQGRLNPATVTFYALRMPVQARSLAGRVLSGWYFPSYAFESCITATLNDANPSAPAVPVQRWLLGILLRARCAPRLNKLPAMPLRALDRPGSWVRLGLCIGCDHAAQTRKEITWPTQRNPPPRSAFTRLPQPSGGTKTRTVSSTPSPLSAASRTTKANGRPRQRLTPTSCCFSLSLLIRLTPRSSNSGLTIVSLTRTIQPKQMGQGASRALPPFRAFKFSMSKAREENTRKGDQE